MKNPKSDWKLFASIVTHIPLLWACCGLESWRCGAADIVVNARPVDGWAVELTWQGQGGRQYHLEFKTNLADTAWQLVPAEIVGCDYTPSINLVICTNLPNRFFRVVDFADTSQVVGFCSPTNDCVACHQFSIGMEPGFTNDVLVTARGFLLGKVLSGMARVFDGPATGSPIIDFQMLSVDLQRDPRVRFAYPGRTDYSLAPPYFYDDSMLLKLKAPFTNVNSVLADYHLAFAQYLSRIDIYVVTVLAKTDDPYFIEMAATGDPRLEYLDISVFGDPRGSGSVDCTGPP